MTALKAEDFTLLDNGQAVKLLSFKAPEEASAEPPTELVLLVDSNNLSSSRIALVREQLNQFLLRNDGHLAMPVTIYLPNNNTLLVTPQSSTDGKLLAGEIAHKNLMRAIEPQLRQVNSSGNPADNLLQHNMVSELYRSNLNVLGSILLEERKKPGRKLLLWLGNGWYPDAESSTFNQIVELSTRMREARVTLSSLSAWAYPMHNPSFEEFVDAANAAHGKSGNYLSLPVLASQSGGRVLDPGENPAAQDDLVALIDRSIQSDRNAYSIFFDPPPTRQADEYHAVNVQLKTPMLTARTRTAYYDEPTFYDQPNPAVVRLKIAELEEILGKARKHSDAELARKLGGMELTERMSSGKLSAWKGKLRGVKSWNALVALADASAFLAPPASEILATPAPELKAQRQIMATTLNYLEQVLPKLPNFFATRTTVSYEEPQAGTDRNWKVPLADESLQVVANFTATVQFRDGHEVVDTEAAKGKVGTATPERLTTFGTFGPILSTVITDAAHGEMRWSRWEQGTDGPVAVFHYVVPEKESHYQVKDCCVIRGNDAEEFELLPRYQGEITIDPKSGAILRLTESAVLPQHLPMVHSGIMVEYGPVEISGKNYICPIRSVAIVRDRTDLELRQWLNSMEIYGPFKTELNDVSFGEYHKFGSTARILTDYETVPTK